jgi:iron complex outermembrane receptor protein
MPNRLPTIYPTGFSPQETFNEEDYAFTAGIKGKVFGNWNWDLSSTYGKDTQPSSAWRTRPTSRCSPTPAPRRPSSSAGKFVASQWTNNLDLSREFDVGWATPLTFAVGLEHRRDEYEIGAGDAASRYKEGSQSFPGFSLTDAGSHSRNNKAAYVDLAGQPMADLDGRPGRTLRALQRLRQRQGRQADQPLRLFAGVGVRGTYSNGFRAPTLAEEYYSATNVSPRSAFVQLAPNSAGAAGRRERPASGSSTNVSAGIVLNPAANLAITLDAYQITIRDRIVGSGSLYGSGGAVNSPAVTAAILANGNVLDPTVVQTGINIFSNAVNTRAAAWNSSPR